VTYPLVAVVVLARTIVHRWCEMRKLVKPYGVCAELYKFAYQLRREE
jgi:hypothetical protein